MARYAKTNTDRGRVHDAILETFSAHYPGERGAVSLSKISTDAGVTRANLMKCVRTDRLTWKVAGALRALEHVLQKDETILTDAKLGQLMLPATS